MVEIKITLLVKHQIGDTVEICASQTMGIVSGYVVRDDLSIGYLVRWMFDGYLHQVEFGALDLTSIGSGKPHGEANNG